jgi:hypothetical protein
MVNSPTGGAQASQLQLNDIHVPEQISNFPIAPGWWILLALVIFTAIWLYKRHKKNTLLNADKKKALSILASNNSLSAKECIALLKWSAMQYFSRQELARLYGDDFKTFLIKQLPEKHQDNFTKLSAAAFDSQYQVQENTTSAIDSDCQQATKLWLEHALPVQKDFTKAHVDADNINSESLTSNDKAELSS